MYDTAFRIVLKFYISTKAPSLMGCSERKNNPAVVTCSRRAPY